MQCGLLGRHLGHSYSPQIHAQLGSYDYELVEKEPEDVEAFLKSKCFQGLNVTIPYKKTALACCDELSAAAAQMGAVNTVVCRDGRLIGHNTDRFGFMYMLRASGLEAAGKKALVLGSGGASNTAVAVLRELGAEVVVISRSGENHYGNLKLHADAALIVNATPVGMYPNTGVSPVDLGIFPRLEGVLDLIYNPARTKLLLDAENRGLVAENGLSMLVAQAKESAEWFTGNKIADDVIETVLGSLRRRMENIILIGMPGCGKSTVAKLLSQALGRTAVDADAELEKHACRSIPDIITRDGEDAFRKLETKVLAQLGMQSGLIIATGGGCVTREENYPLLHQNGRIYYLTRDLEKLPTEGRPLSQSGRLSELYEARKPMYQRFADCTVSNDGTQEDTVRAIMEDMQ